MIPSHDLPSALEKSPNNRNTRTITSSELTSNQRHRSLLPSLPNQLRLIHGHPLPTRHNRSRFRTRRPLVHQHLVHEERNSKACHDLLLRHPLRPSLLQTDRLRHPAHARSRRSTRMVLAVRHNGRFHLRERPCIRILASGLFQKSAQCLPPQGFAIKLKANTHSQDKSPARRPDERAEEEADWSCVFQETGEKHPDMAIPYLSSLLFDHPTDRNNQHQLTDWRMWLHFLITLCNSGPTRAFDTYAPTFVRSLGFAALTSNALTCVGLFLQIPIAFAFSYVSDR